MANFLAVKRRFRLPQKLIDADGSPTENDLFGQPEIADVVARISTKNDHIG